MRDSVSIGADQAANTETAIVELAREIGSLGVAFADVAGHVDDVSGRIAHQV